MIRTFNKIIILKQYLIILLNIKFVLKFRGEKMTENWDVLTFVCLESLVLENYFLGLLFLRGKCRGTQKYPKSCGLNNFKQYMPSGL